MTAYNPPLLRNSFIVKKSKQWYSRQLISLEQLNTILKNYEPGFYSPGLFIKIGLFIFTAIAIAAAAGFYTLFFALINMHSGTGIFVFSCVLFSVLCVIALEYFIRSKNVYRAGVDECLLYAALIFVFFAIGIMINELFENSDNTLLNCILALPFILAAVVRYADQFVALAAAACLYSIFFLSLLKLGDIAKLIMPFALMAVSVPVYFAARKQKERDDLFYWKNCFIVFEYAALIVFYAAGNYFVIREASAAFFNLQLKEGENIPLAFLFYFLTAAIPLLYVYYGLKRKDKVLLWCGLLFIAAAVLTFKYYFSLGHPEITLTIAGLIMIAIAYTYIRILKTPKHGITFEEEPDEDNFLKSNAEALVISQNFGQHAQTPSDTASGGPDFGGGSFGGAGSGGNY